MTSTPTMNTNSDKAINKDSRDQAFVHLLGNMDSRDHYAHLLYPLYNDYYQTLNTRSISAGDVRITRCSPTPTNSSGVSSCAASIGDMSTCSAPTPPLSALSSGQVSPCQSVAASPETNRRNWRKKWMRVRDDLEGICQRMKSPSLNEDCSCDKNTENSSKRTVKVEFEDDKSRASKHIWQWAKRHRRHHGRVKDDMDLTSAYHVRSPQLALKAIENSIFHAEVSLSHLPPGNLTLRVNDYRLLIIVTKQCVHNSDHDNSPVAYGELQLPIYVRPASLHFEYIEERQALVILGRAKSYGISVSSIDLSKSSESALSPKNRRKAMLQTIWSSDVTSIGDDVYNSTKTYDESKTDEFKAHSFRRRSFTR